MKKKPIVVFDIDQTIADGSDPPNCRARPGIREWMLSLKLLGFDVRVWTRARLTYATHLVATIGLEDIVTGCHEKPRWEKDARITQEDAVRILGALPALTVDDWDGESIDGVPFLKVDAWDGEQFGPLRF